MTSQCERATQAYTTQRLERGSGGHVIPAEREPSREPSRSLGPSLQSGPYSGSLASSAQSKKGRDDMLPYMAARYHIRIGEMGRSGKNGWGEMGEGMHTASPAPLACEPAP